MVTKTFRHLVVNTSFDVDNQAIPISAVYNNTYDNAGRLTKTKYGFTLPANLR
jgi:hypothetical protein